MDRATLERMGAKVDKARKIVEAIDSLKRFKLEMELIGAHEVVYEIELRDKKGDEIEYLTHWVIGEEPIKAIAAAVIAEAGKQIEQLEKKLADL